MSKNDVNSYYRLPNLTPMVIWNVYDSSLDQRDYLR